MKPATRPGPYGLMAEFDDPTSLVSAARRARHEGYREIDGYTPYPIEELHEALEFHDSRLPKLVLMGGLLGGIGGYGLQYWVSVIVYPMNVGGRLPHSGRHSFRTFRCAICGPPSQLARHAGAEPLPQPHPVFNVPLAPASRNDFLCIEARDPKFTPASRGCF